MERVKRGEGESEEEGSGRKQMSECQLCKFGQETTRRHMVGWQAHGGVAGSRWGGRVMCRGQLHCNSLA